MTINLPRDVAIDAYHRNFGFYCFCGRSEDTRTVDLGGPPVDGEMDALGNRPVVHSNVIGESFQGTKLKLHDGKPASCDAILYISTGRTAGTYYNTYLPQPVYGTAVISPPHNGRYEYCKIICSISGDDKTQTITAQVKLGPYRGKKGKVEPSVSGCITKVRTDNSQTVDYAVCGRTSLGSNSKMGLTIQSAFSKKSLAPSDQAERMLIRGFKPPVYIVQLAHIFLMNRRITIGDDKAILDAFSNLRYAAFNGLAFTKDTSRLVRDTFRLVRDFKRVKHDPSRLGSIWLSYRYGHRLYFNDCRTLLQAADSVRRARPLKFRGRHVEELSIFEGTKTRVECNFTLYASPFCLQDLGFEQTLRALDFWPSAENLWDLVPYSFIADWFINLTDVCRRYDAQADMLRFPIKGALQSVKISTQSIVGNSAGAGYATVTLYNRTPLTPAKLSTLLSSVTLSVMDGMSLLHLADALALAVSRRR